MLPLATDLFDYHLPGYLVAQVPPPRRDQSRLLVVDRASRNIAHRTFDALPEYLRPGDTLFRNNASVLPARLHANRPTGGQVECFLLGATDDPACWRCLVKPGRKLPVGARFSHPSTAFTGEIVAKEIDGSAVVRFATKSGESIATVANRLGEVPLPPYIARETSASKSNEQQRTFDLERYQTVYANRDRQVAVAAPTAGLHFTPELLVMLSTQGVHMADITLHVGLGTFKPIETPTVDAHPSHREVYEIPIETQRAIFPPLPGRRIAVGTTSVRSIEDFLTKQTQPVEAAASWTTEAGIYLRPPAVFRGVDALITNFHQPRSTLLCLVAAFLTPGSTDGITWFREIYQEAIAREYRFFSYGDAMLIL